ncbi:bacteriophage Gp15 family protein [Irregularibacter muris]|uniref:Bacteriophage Gp15 family protein n=1 Tax=Irregularibacter muris TaxID=1796619 RepID=A0AAE3HCU8_9FIRM|nr:bacteriophage Gp15 family protein [Irregularibacter muris]MCR1897816.1 bacteriophage Gp15 family protein [Irregularibacter muris]
MNILIDLVPETVVIDDIEYQLNTDFRISILFELLMQDNTLVDNEKIDIALNLYYPKLPHDPIQAIEKVLWFYSCARENDEGSNGAKDEPTNKVEVIYSFEYDDEYIYSAFLDQYGIDLQDVEYLHWWKFRALFKSLKEDNLISKIMGYRAISIDNDMSEQEKKYYRKMKKIYALPDNRTQEEKERDFNSAIFNML